MNQIDEYATLRAAFHAGATIQAYTVEGYTGEAHYAEVEGLGYWRDLSCDGEPAFSCHFSRYRVKDHHPAEAPVAEVIDADWGAAFNLLGPMPPVGSKLYLCPYAEVDVALRSTKIALANMSAWLADAEATIARVRALADHWQDFTKAGYDGAETYREVVTELRAALEGSE
jgi:hypothetical protein